jgi:hypothetical protein
MATFGLGKTVLSLVCLAAAAVAGPVVARQTTPPTSGSVWMPEMYNIYPQIPDLSKPPVSGLHIENFGNLSQIEQVAVFRGIPAEAKACELMWSQANWEDRVFIVKGTSGLTRMRQLSDLPMGNITFNSIQPFDTATDDEQFGPDFTSWDSETYAEQDHIGGAVKCAEEIYIKVALRTPETRASVYLGQDQKNGLWVSYTV